MHGHLRQRGFERNPAADFGVAGAGFGLAVRDERLTGPQNRNGRRVASQTLGAGRDVVAERAHLLDAARGAENTLGVSGGERPAAVRLSGLEQERPAPHGRHDRERPLRLVPLPLEIHAVDFCRVGEHACLHVHFDRVRVPAFPQAGAHLHVFVRALVAFVVGRQVVQAEVPRLRAGRGRHDVPADPPARQMVQRRQRSRQQERRIERRGHGHRKAEFGCDGGQPRHQGDRVVAGKLDRIADLRRLRAAGQPVREEQHVELAAFQRPRDRFPVVALVPAVADLVPRIDPRQRHVRRGREQHEAGQMDLLVHRAYHQPNWKVCNARRR